VHSPSARICSPHPAVPSSSHLSSSSPPPRPSPFSSSISSFHPFFPPPAGPIIESKTIDGVSVVAGISFQYQLPRDPAALCKLVQEYGVEPGAAKTFYIAYVRAAARDAIGEFEVVDFWQQRSVIAIKVKDRVRASIEAHSGTMLGFQLLTLDIPDAIQREIEDTTVQSQRVFQLQLQQQGAQVAAVTRQLQAQVTAEISIIAAGASGNATIVSTTAEAAALNLTISAEARAYASLKSALNLTNEELMALVYIDTLLKTPAAGMRIQAPLPSVLDGGH
jgi:regulator of protease activity HflC (stomatin/prohibitin superfamily)